MTSTADAVGGVMPGLMLPAGATAATAACRSALRRPRRDPGEVRHAAGLARWRWAAASARCAADPRLDRAGQGRVQAPPPPRSWSTLDVEHLPYNEPLLEWLRAAARRRPPDLPGHCGGCRAGGASRRTSGSSPACWRPTAQPTWPAATSWHGFHGALRRHFTYIGNASPDAVIARPASRRWWPIPS